jgi:HPt (histidine-containing phosphotransfer) domain-containing protein
MDKGRDAVARGVFDWADLLDTVGGDTGILEELVDMFLVSVPGQMEKIGTALKQNDYLVAQREAHKLKGTSANIRAPFLHAAFANLEEAAKEQDLSRAGQLLVDCRNGFDHFVEVYRTGF